MGGAGARVGRAVLRDFGRWIWWLRIPLLAPGFLFGAALILVALSPVLAVVLYVGYGKGERWRAIKDSFARSPRGSLVTWQAIRPPRTHVVRNIRDLGSALVRR